MIKGGDKLIELSDKLEKGELSSNKVSYPKIKTEFEIQSYIYSKLLGKGYNVRGEVKSKDGVCRFDVVIFNEKNKAIEIIEVKNTSYAKNSWDYHSRHQQINKYRNYCPNVVQVKGMSNAIGYVRSKRNLKFKPRKKESGLNPPHL